MIATYAVRKTPTSGARLFWGRRPAAMRSALLASAALITAGGAPAWADPAAILERWAQADGDVISVSFGDLGQSGDRLTVTDLEIDLAIGEIARAAARAFGGEDNALDGTISYAIRFPEIVFDGLTEDDGHYSVNQVTAGGATIAFDVDIADEPPQTSEVDYGAISASRLRWSKMPEIGEPDPERPVSRFLPLLRAANDISYTDMTVDGATSISKVPDGNVTITQEIGPMVLRNSVRGDVERMEIAGVTVTSDADVPEARFEIEIGPVTVDTSNSGTALAILLGDRTADDYQPVLGSLVVDGVRGTMAAEDAEFAVERIEMNGLGVRSPEAAVPQLLDTLIASVIADPDYEPSPQQVMQLVGSIYGPFRLGDVEVSGLSVTGPEFDRFTIGAYGIRDLSAEGLASAYLRGLHVDASDGTIVRYDEFEIADIGFPSLAALAELAAMSDEADDDEDAFDIDLLLASLPIIGRIVSSGVEIVVPEEDAELSIAGSVLEMTDHIGPVPTRIGMTLTGLELPIDVLDPEQREPMLAMGYDRVNLSYDLLLRWNEESSALTLDGDIDLAEMGRLDFDAEVGNVPRLLFERPDQTGLMSALGATFDQANVRFVDQSIVGRALAFGGTQNGLTQEQMGQQVQGMFAAAVSQLGDAQLSAEAAAAVEALLESGSPLTVGIVAPSPLPVVALVTAAQANPGSIIDVLEITVSND